MMTTTDPATELREDGDKFELPDGRTLRLRVLPDSDADLNDYDCWGKVEPCPDHPYDRDGMRTNHRPDGFDGNAERMWLQQNNGCIWWQPPKDVKRTDPNFADLRRNVNDLASFGFCGYVVELLDGVDAYDRPIVVGTASLWAIEPFADRDFVVDTVRDLVAEVLA